MQPRLRMHSGTYKEVRRYRTWPWDYQKNPNDNIPQFRVLPSSWRPGWPSAISAWMADYNARELIFLS